MEENEFLSTHPSQYCLDCLRLNTLCCNVNVVGCGGRNPRCGDGEDDSAASSSSGFLFHPEKIGDYQSLSQRILHGRCCTVNCASVASFRLVVDSHLPRRGDEAFSLLGARVAEKRWNWIGSRQWFRPSMLLWIALSSWRQLPTKSIASAEQTLQLPLVTLAAAAATRRMVVFCSSSCVVEVLDGGNMSHGYQCDSYSKLMIHKHG
jgi:hypothetical protein